MEVHAHTCAVAPALLEKTFSALTEELVNEISRAFRQVPRFGMGGFLTVSASPSYWRLLHLIAFKHDAYLSRLRWR